MEIAEDPKEQKAPTSPPKASLAVILAAASPLRRCGEVQQQTGDKVQKEQKERVAQQQTVLQPSQPDQAQEPETVKDLAAAQRARDQVARLWEAIGAAAPPQLALEALQCRAAAARAAAEAEFERRWQAQLWEFVEEGLDYEAFGSVVRTVRGGPVPLPVHVVRRLFENSPQEWTPAGGSGHRASSRGHEPPAALPVPRSSSRTSLTRQASTGAPAPRAPSRASVIPRPLPGVGLSDSKTFAPTGAQPIQRGGTGVRDQSPSVRDRIRAMQAS
eukprot:CAMPEP_0115105492 /NCGR_PEP_ID=MMETSP0227-20121206/36028_1 /TAXON_ID=89957 /ORGANISM="Polarella glacialis, Strain CCMP 1383" /LENGTH=272 /DNA_ID=CAMNT_0002502781 /DNA_START=62 /DNA_END=880 /DNA_ORIENTATION=+